MAWILLHFEGSASFRDSKRTSSHAPQEYCAPRSAESDSAVAIRPAREGETGGLPRPLAQLLEPVWGADLCASCWDSVAAGSRDELGNPKRRALSPRDAAGCAVDLERCKPRSPSIYIRCSF